LAAFDLIRGHPPMRGPLCVRPARGERRGHQPRADRELEAPVSSA
jgi:hypothetical protein